MRRFLQLALCLLLGLTSILAQKNLPLMGVGGAAAANAGALVGTPVYGTGAPAVLNYTIIGTTNHILVVCADSASTENFTVSDTKGLTWTAVSTVLDNGNRATRCFTSSVPTSTGADTITVTATFDSTLAAQVTEFSGVITTSPIDGTPAKATGTGTAAASGTFTTGQVDLLVGWVFCFGENITAGSGWTGTPQAATFRMLEYQVDKAAGTYNAQATCNTGGWLVWGFAIKEL